LPPITSTSLAYAIVDGWKTTDAECPRGRAPGLNSGHIRHEFFVDAFRIISTAISHVLDNAIVVGPTAVIGSRVRSTSGGRSGCGGDGGGTIICCNLS
jgi:hypothetical protein